MDDEHDEPTPQVPPSPVDAAVAAGATPDVVEPPPGDPTVATAVAVAPQRHRARSIVATVLGVLTVLVLVISVVAVWARATVLRRQPVADLVGDALAEPDVQAALAQKITDEVFSAVDVQARLTALLPDQLDRFAGTIAGGAEAAVERAVTQVLSREDVQQVIVTIVERAHDRLIRLLEGDGLSHGISVANGTITLNLLPLVGRGLTEVKSFGLLDNVTVPELAADGDPDQQIAQLSQALGRPLPAGFGQLVVYQSDSVDHAQSQVQAAQRIFALAQRAVWLIVILWIVLAAATILVAPRRWRAALLLGLGTAGALVLLRSSIRRVVDDAPSLAKQPGGKAAIDAIVGGAATSLLRVAGVMLLVGLIVAAGAMLRRRQWRSDLVIAGAVAAGVAVVAAIGISIWSLLIGLIVGIAVPFVAGRLLPPPGGGPVDPPAAAAT